MVRGDGPWYLGTVGRLPDHPDPAGAVEHHGQSGADQLVVVDNQNPDRPDTRRRNGCHAGHGSRAMSLNS